MDDLRCQHGLNPSQFCGQCVDGPGNMPAAPPEAKPTFAPDEPTGEPLGSCFNEADHAYELADEVWAMVHEHLPHGVGETIVRQLWPLLVELVNRRKAMQLAHARLVRWDAAQDNYALASVFLEALALIAPENFAPEMQAEIEKFLADKEKR